MLSPQRVRPTRLLSHALLILSVLLAAVPAGAAQGAARPKTPTNLPKALEAVAPWVPVVSCEPVARAGVTAFGQLLRKTYPKTRWADHRSCGKTAADEHYDGRALDWKVSTRSKARSAEASAMLSWLMKTDANGNQYALARRTGVMYVIWDNRLWRADQAAAGWRPYADCATHPGKKDDARCHRSSMQIGFGWAGALRQTSFWSKRVAAQDFGPCPAADLRWSPGYTRANPTPCPARRPATAPVGSSSLTRSLVAYSGMRLQVGSSGPAVKAVKSVIGASADASFGKPTRTRLRTWQTSHRLPASGITDATTWRAMLAERASTSGASSPQTPAGGTQMTPMPSSSPAGWRRVYSEDFTKVSALGSFTTISKDDWYLSRTNAYADSLRSYPDGWGTTGDSSLNYASKTADVVPQSLGADGVFRLNAYTASINGSSKALAGSFFPVINAGASGGKAQMSQTYGRYSVRFRTVGGYKSGSTKGYGSAFLLWPADDQWSKGEVDFPEMAWGQNIKGYVHQIGSPQNNAAVISTSTKTEGDWHVATIEWYPGVLTFAIDGQQVGRVAGANVPSTPFRWGFQSGGHDGTPAGDVKGQLLVDWITVDAYAGATAPR